MSNSPNENQDAQTGAGGDHRETVQSPHDRLLSRALAHKESSQELIRSHLPAEIASCLKLETIEQADTSFIDANLKRRFADRLFEIEVTEEVAEELGVKCPYIHLLVLIDHKSTSDKNTVIQMLGYIVRIWEHCIENHSPLLPIIPWVLYNGPKPWAAPRSLAELIPILESWKRYTLGIEIPIFDIGREEDSEMSGELILQMTLFR